MDLTLAIIGFLLIALGFALNFIGVWLQRRGRKAEEKGTWIDWIGEAIRGMFTAWKRALGNYSMGVKVQALGSALSFLGLVFVLVFLAQQFAGTNDGGVNTPSPSPGGSAGSS